MASDWVTLDKFEEITGVNREYVRKECNKGSWPEHIAWDKLSPKIYLINVAWWNKWRETAAASKRRQNQASRSNLLITGSGAVSESRKSPHPETFAWPND